MSVRAGVVSFLSAFLMSSSWVWRACLSLLVVARWHDPADALAAELSRLTADDDGNDAHALASSTLAAAPEKAAARPPPAPAGKWTVDGVYFFATYKDLQEAWKDADLVCIDTTEAQTLARARCVHAPHTHTPILEHETKNKHNQKRWTSSPIRFPLCEQWTRLLKRTMRTGVL